MMKKNIQKPPQAMIFRDLFKFIWKEGLGNLMTSKGDIQPWDEVSLTDAFEEYGSTLGENTAKRWREGGGISNKNRTTLAKLVSGGKQSLEREWREELFHALQRQKHKRTDLVPPTRIQHVTDLKVCGTEHFNDNRQACSQNGSYFPAGTKLIYLSFVFSGVKKGQTFERRWYLNGEKFRDIIDFYDDAWPGYTYLWNESGHDSGNYSVRIIVNDQVTTATFVVGDT